MKLQYSVSNHVVNVSGILQIVLGAALTAPGAAVTILGAVSTVIAGMLTYLKGQGLPMRLEQYLHLLRMLKEHIEEVERQLLEPDCRFNVDEEINRAAKMYQGGEADGGRQRARDGVTAQRGHHIAVKEA